MYRHRRRFFISDFTQHDNIRILTHNRTQSCGKGKSAPAVDRHLINPRQLIFHRILQSYNIAGRSIKLLERGI